MNKTQKSKTGLLFIVTGPTGGGKTTVVAHALPQLVQQYPIERVITYTTRNMRSGEENGRDYFFVSRLAFAKLESEDFFFEVAQYNGALYGSPRDFLAKMAQGNSFIAITNRAGLITYSALSDDVVKIWVTAQSIDAIESRLRRRTGVDEEVTQQRIALAAAEMKIEQEHQLCTHRIVTDDNVERAAQEFIAIVKNYLD